MTPTSQILVKTYSSWQDADYAVKALVQIAGLPSEQVRIQQGAENSDLYGVYIKAPDDVVQQARTFLAGPSAGDSASDPRRSPYGLKHARDLMAFDDFG